MLRRILLVPILLCCQAIAQDQKEVVELLRSADWEKSLTRILSDRTRLSSYVIAALTHEDAKVRARAAAAIRAIDSVDVESRAEENDGIGKERTKAVAALLKTAGDADSEVRKESIWALAYLLRNKKWGHHGEPWSEVKEVQPLVELGKEATPALVQLLAREDANDGVLYGVKIAVTRVLGITKDPRAVDALIQAVKSADHFRLSEAMKALSQFDDIRVVPTLIERIDEGIPSYSDTPAIWALLEIRERATPFLVAAITEHPKPGVRSRSAHFFEHAPDPRAVTSLQRATSDPDEYVRANAAGSLGHNPSPGNAQCLLPLLQDSSKVVRTAAATSLGLLKVTASYEPIVSLLKDEDVDVRRAAIYALAGLDPKRSVSLLIGQLGDQNTQYTVVDALKPFKPKEAEEALIEVAKSGEQYARNAAADLLGEMKSTKAIPVLLTMLADDEWYPRTAAVRALGLIGAPAFDGVLALIPKAGEGVLWDALITLGATQDARAFDVIAPYLNHEKVRLGAIAAIGKTGDKRAIPLILPLLESHDGDTLRYAVEAAGDLKAIDAVPFLIKALDFVGDYVASTAAEALAKIADKRAFEPLLKAAQNPEFEGRWMAIESLGDLSDGRAVPVLIQLLDVGWPESAAAARALGKIGDPSAIQALERIAKGDDERTSADAKAAIEAIRKKPKA